MYKRQLQALALDIKLDHLDEWNLRRQEVHARYVEGLDGFELLATLDGGSPVHHLEVVRVDDRDAVRETLGQQGIQTGIHYALPCHKHPAFAEFDRRPLPVAEAAAGRQFSLPMHPTLTDAEVQRVIDAMLAMP